MQNPLSLHFYQNDLYTHKKPYFSLHLRTELQMITPIQNMFFSFSFNSRVKIALAFEYMTFQILQYYWSTK